MYGIKTFFCVFFVAMAFTACKKDNSLNINGDIQLNLQNNGTSITAAAGESILLTLQNPGDGGYDFDTPQFDGGILNLLKHVHTAPTSNNIGDYGIDTWLFVVTSSGNTALTIPATRFGNNNSQVTMFSVTIKVN